MMLCWGLLAVFGILFAVASAVKVPESFYIKKLMIPFYKISIFIFGMFPKKRTVLRSKESGKRSGGC